ncbi:MAG: hypothetical protein AABZ60_00885, partial [Planctomycetota bacterium]
MKNEDDFSLGSALLVFFLVVLIGISASNGNFFSFPSESGSSEKSSLSSSFPEKNAQENPHASSSKIISLPEEKRSLSLIPLPELARLFHPAQRKSLDAEMDHLKHDNNALVRIISLKN